MPSREPNTDSRRPLLSDRVRARRGSWQGFQGSRRSIGLVGSRGTSRGEVDGLGSWVLLGLARVPWPRGLTRARGCARGARRRESERRR